MTKVDKPMLRKQVLINNTFKNLDKHHDGLPRNVICKVKNKPLVKKMYILYLKGQQTPKSVVTITDYAGFFNELKDAMYVKKCLNNLFEKIHDTTWNLDHGGYTVEPLEMNNILDSSNKSSTKHVYTVEGQYTSKTKLDATDYKLEYIIGITDNRFEVKDLIKKYKDEVGDFSKWKPVYNEANNSWIHFESKIYTKEYYINDVMPTMYLSDYDGSKHKEHVRKIASGLQFVISGV